jgi:hypothetical protein
VCASFAHTWISRVSNSARQRCARKTSRCREASFDGADAVVPLPTIVLARLRRAPWRRLLPGVARKLAHPWLISDHASGVCFQPDRAGRKLARCARRLRTPGYRGSRTAHARGVREKLRDVAKPPLMERTGWFHYRLSSSHASGVRRGGGCYQGWLASSLTPG